MPGRWMTQLMQQIIAICCAALIIIPSTAVPELRVWAVANQAEDEVETKEGAAAKTIASSDSRRRLERRPSAPLVRNFAGERPTRSKAAWQSRDGRTELQSRFFSLRC